MEFITLAVITFVCLLFETTQKFGMFLFVILFLAFPLTFICLAAIVIHLINRYKFNRRMFYTPTFLPSKTNKQSTKGIK